MHPDPGAAGEQALPGAPADPVAASPPAQLSGSPVAPGQRWHAYQIGDAIPSEDGWKFHAVNVGMLDDVNIHVRPLGDNPTARSEAWLKLQNGKYPGLIQLVEAIEEDGFRFEITQVPPPTQLREWANTHQASLDDVESLLRQLAATVQAIQSVGVVHCNLSLDTIHLADVDSGLKVLIGGLDYVTLYEQPGLVSLPVNPLYAPPEAAGLTRHRAGPGLRGWDWWSLGRLMQELVLGQPVLGIILDRDVSRMTPEIKARAETLLLERDAICPKAGAVEKMPRMSDDLSSLLRGLLTSSRDGRWGWREVQCWLKRETVPDRYDLTRNDRLFLWKDRSFTVAEAADFFTAEANWAEGVEQIFDNKSAASFLSFVMREQELSPVREQLETLRDFFQLPAWREFPVEVVRTLIAAASWLQIGFERRPFLLRGRKVDLPFLRSLIKAEPVAEGLALVRALLAPPFIQLVGVRDADTARLLTTVSGNAQDVIAQAEKNEWLKPGDAEVLARLMLCVLEGDADLIRHREDLRKRFALTRDAQLETIFKAPKARHKDLILLAFAAGDPERTGFVTHAEWSRERYHVLRERGERLAAKLFWLRLSRVLKAGPLVFGRWPWVALGWIFLGGLVAALAAPPAGLIAGPALVAALCALRLALFAWQRREVVTFSQVPEPWTLRSSSRRCRVEAVSVLPAEAGSTLPEVLAELHAINREIGSLPLEPPPAAIRLPPPPLINWAGTVGSWVLVTGMSVWTALSISSPEDLRLPTDHAHAGDVAPDGRPAEPVRPKITLTSEEIFFSDPRSLYESWAFEEPAQAPALAVRGYAKPTPEQVAAALIDGQKLLAPYAPQTARGVLAVPVLLENDEAGVVLYDVTRRMLLDRRIFKLEKLPAPERSWHELESVKVLYLGEPPVVNIEMWGDDALDLSGLRPVAAQTPAKPADSVANNREKEIGPGH